MHENKTTINYADLPRLRVRKWDQVSRLRLILSLVLKKRLEETRKGPVQVFSEKPWEQGWEVGQKIRR